MGGKLVEQFKADVEQTLAHARVIVAGLPPLGPSGFVLSLYRIDDRWGSLMDSLRHLRRARIEIRRGLRSVVCLRDEELTAEQCEAKRRKVSQAKKIDSVLTRGIREMELMVRSHIALPKRPTDN